MPNINFNDIDTSTLPSNLRERYLSQVRQGQKLYYWGLMAFGCLLVIVGGVM